MGNAAEKHIKSAERVLDIFELFSDERRSVTVMEVARELNTPQSSTSELLASLVRRGYLMKERGSRIFRPTARVALLGSWVHPSLFRTGNLLPMMDRLSEQTGMGVALCLKVGVSLKHIHSVGHLPADLAGSAQRHLLHSPFGHALLSTMFSNDVRLLVHRLNAESEAEDRVAFSELAADLAEVNKRGAAIGEAVPGWTGIAVLLPQSGSEEQLSVGIIGQSAKVDSRRDDLLRCLRQSISGHLGPRVVSDSAEPSAPPRHSGAYG